jgi:hypothetical protein
LERMGAMPAQRRYPEELRERAVKMVVEIQAREGRGRGEVARVARQLAFTGRRCGCGSARRRSIAGSGRVPAVRMRGVLPSWNGKCGNCGARMRY